MHPVCVNSASVCRRALLRVGSQTRPGTERGRETVCRNRRSRFGDSLKSFESSCAKLTHVYRGRVHRWMLWQRIAVIIALVCATPCEGMAPGVQKLAPDFRSMSLAAKEDFVRRQVRAVKHARRLLILILGGWRKTDGHLAADRRASRRKTVPCVQQNLLTLRLQRQGRAGCDWRGVHTD